MTHAHPLLEALVADADDGPVLRGSRCGQCNALFFPLRAACERCGANAMHEQVLPRRGHLWSWTSQNFPPPAPPYFRAEDKAAYVPYCVGYVDLGEILVLARVHADAGLQIGARMHLELRALPGADPGVPTQIPVFVADGVAA